MNKQCKNRSAMMLDFNTIGKYKCCLHFGNNTKFEFIKINDTTVRLFRNNMDFEIPIEDFNKYFVEIN